MATSVTVTPAPSLYKRLRDFLHHNPQLYKIARTARFALMVGPLRPLIVSYYRKFSPNPEVKVTGHTLFPDLNASGIASTLEEKGFALCGALPEDCVAGIVAAAGPMKPGNIYNPHEKVDAVRRVVFDPAFVGIARNYFGAEPIVCASKMWWSIPAARRDQGSAEAAFDTEHAATFHFDVADCRSLIGFIYLTDVEEDCGPHMVIEGTHKGKTLADLVQVYIGDSAAMRRFGAQRIKTVLGKKGTFFFEEQTAYHKGVPAKKPRLILGVNYTLHRKPVQLLD
jgi:hypothetical protein